MERRLARITPPLLPTTAPMEGGDAQASSSPTTTSTDDVVFRPAKGLLLPLPLLVDIAPAVSSMVEPSSYCATQSLLLLPQSPCPESCRTLRQVAHVLFHRVSQAVSIHKVALLIVAFQQVLLLCTALAQYLVHGHEAQAPKRQPFKVRWTCSANCVVDCV